MIVAHRGESYLAPENTLAAIRLAWELGAQCVECDVHLTADGALAVIHNADTKHTGDKTLVVKDATFEQLQTVDVGQWKDAKWAGERIPAVKQVLATVPEGRQLLVEVKVGPEAVAPLLRAIESSGKPAGRFAVISFHTAVIAEVKKLAPSQQAFWISAFKQDKQTGAWSPTADQLFAAAKQCHADGLCLEAKAFVDPAFVAKVKNAGLLLNVWTIDTPEVVQRYLTYGVDSVTTNRAAWIREQLGLANRKQAPGAKGSNVCS